MTKSSYEVIPHRVWSNINGRTASIYGARPHGAGWAVVDAGWTIRNPLTNETGMGRKPCATHAEAQALAERMGRPSSIGMGS